MNVARMIVTVGVGADDSLMSCKMLAAKLLAQLLRSVNRQAVFNAVAWVKADYVMVAFNIAPTAVFAVMQIRLHTRDCKVIVTAIQSSEAAIFARNKPSTFVENGFVRELVMLKKQIFLGRAIVGIFRA